MANRKLALALFGTLSIGFGLPQVARAGTRPSTALPLPAGKAPAESEQARSARVIWTEVSIASREKRPDLERHLRQVVERHTHELSWGTHRRPIEARFAVTEFSVALGHDVVRVTCTGVGKLQGGQSVRSHFSMGGRPAGRAELERQLLTMMGRGIVGRLAEIARARS